MTAGWDFGAPWALLWLIPVWLLLVQPSLTGRNVLAVAQVDAMKSRWTLRLLLAWVPGALRLAGLTLVVIALARPQVVVREVVVESEGLDIILALDTSGSMKETDFRMSGGWASRLAAAKGVMREFVKGRPYDRIGVVLFGEDAFTHVPLTTDQETLQSALARVDIGDAGQRGTAIGHAVAVSAKRLKDLEAPDRVVILLTDGQDNASDEVSPMRAAQAAAALDIKVYTIGVGGSGGMLGQLLQTGVDEHTLRAISEATDAQYFRAADTRALQRVFDAIDELEPSPAEVDEIPDVQPLFRYPLVPGVALLLLQFLLSATWLRRGP